MNEKLIEENTILKVVHGSRAYGTNIPGSDFDEKGVCIMPEKKYYYGFSKFEQKDSGWADGKDRVIYDIRKFFRLAAACNPNIIETLYVEPEQLIKCNDIGRILLANRHIFLSQLAANTFTGYAVSQMRKVEKAYEKGIEFVKWKHVMHLIRLLRMGSEIIQYGEVFVRRPDAEYLLEIRHGKKDLEALMDEAHALLAQIEEDRENSQLPERPDMTKIENLLVHIIGAYVPW